MRANSIAIVGSKGLSIYLLAGCLLLSSCKTMESALSLQPMQAKYDNPNDSCQPIRKELVGTQDHFSSNILGGVMIGVATGVLTGLVGGRAGNRRQKVFRNALIGGLAGAAGGYLRAKAERAKDIEDLRQAISSDVHRDTGRVTEMGSILRRLNACRSEQIVAVERKFRDKSLTGEQAQVELKNVRASIESDNTLVSEVLGEVTKRKAVYVESISRVEKRTEGEVLGDAASYKPVESTQPAPTTQYFATKDSNVRAKPSNQAQILGVLAADSQVEVVGPASTNDKWYEVRYKDQEAFVFAKLLDTKKAEPAGPSKTNAPARPKAENDIQEFELVSREVSAEHEMASIELFRQIEEMEELTLI